MTAAKLATSLRSVSAASASAARAAATSATANLQMSELMLLLQATVAQHFARILVSAKVLFLLIFVWQNSSQLIVSQGNQGHHR